MTISHFRSKYFQLFSGYKLKEKIDLMCCLPNKFPLPVFLLINKCDNDWDEKKPWLDDEKLPSVISENQFFNHFYIAADPKRASNMRESLKQKIPVDILEPLKEMIRTILKFKDINEKFLGPNNSFSRVKDQRKGKNKKECSML